jgi:hypothetical protein
LPSYGFIRNSREASNYLILLGDSVDVAIVFFFWVVTEGDASAVSINKG